MYFDRHFAWLKYFTYHFLLVSILAPNYKQHILSPAKVRKVCYSLAELYVRFFYLNLFGGGGSEILETFKGGASYEIEENSDLDIYPVFEMGWYIPVYRTGTSFCS
jgi:hypothetical protein